MTSELNGAAAQCGFSSYSSFRRARRLISFRAKNASRFCLRYWMISVSTVVMARLTLTSIGQMQTKFLGGNKKARPPAYNPGERAYTDKTFDSGDCP